MDLLSFVLFDSDSSINHELLFNKAFEDWCSEKSTYFFRSDGFFVSLESVLGYIVSNPLLGSIFTILLIVLAFHLLPLICRIFRR